MTKTVWKYTFRKPFGEPETFVMPKGASLLRVGMQGSQLCVWACVAPTTPPETETRTLMVSGTGHLVPMMAAYVDGCSFGPLEWHVWELKKRGV